MANLVNGPQWNHCKLERISIIADSVVITEYKSLIINGNFVSQVWKYAGFGNGQDFLVLGQSPPLIHIFL